MRLVVMRADLLSNCQSHDEILLPHGFRNALRNDSCGVGVIKEQLSVS